MTHTHSELQSRAAARRECVGFTLLELLVSMTIVSLLAVTVLFGWRIAASAWQKASSHLERSRTVLETNQLLQEQMSSMLPYRAQNERGPAFFFQGEPQTARFVSRYSLTNRAGSGLYDIEYHIEKSDDGTVRLLLNEFPVRNQLELGALVVGTAQTSEGLPILQFAPFKPGPQSVTLLEGKKNLHFEYYQAASPLIAGVWTRQWTTLSSGVPLAMAIQMDSVSTDPAENGVKASDDSSDLQPTSIVAAVRDYAFRTP